MGVGCKVFLAAYAFSLSLFAGYEGKTTAFVIKRKTILKNYFSKTLYFVFLILMYRARGEEVL